MCLQGTGVDIEEEGALLKQRGATAGGLQEQQAVEEPCLDAGPLMAKVSCNQVHPSALLSTSLERNASDDLAVCF